MHNIYMRFVVTFWFHKKYPELLDMTAIIVYYPEKGSAMAWVNFFWLNLHGMVQWGEVGFMGQGGIKCGNRGTGFLDSEESHR